MQPIAIEYKDGKLRIVISKDRMCREVKCLDSMGVAKWDSVDNAEPAWAAPIHEYIHNLQSAQLALTQTLPPLPDPRPQDIHPNPDSWVPTYTGRRVHPFALKPEDVCVDDIAHHLANIARFGGATKEFYSVAQHSVIASTFVGASSLCKLAVLLHDSAEYLIGDLTTPMKAAYGRIRDIESDIHSTIIKALLGDYAIRILGNEAIEANVKYCDEIMLATEVRDILRTTPEWWKPYLKPDPMLTTIEPWTPKRAEAEFLSRFNALMTELLA